ncbi:MAG: two-component system, OmpR family, sensor histidine kinase SenX3 [Blastocatellia bacterium]
MLVLVAALIALLPLLAVLQVRWLGEVSQAERDRMQASLKTAITNFSQDFDRELTRAYMTFQLDSRTQRDRDWQDYARRYDQWMQAAPYPQLVSGVYLAEPLSQADAPDRLQLYRFDRPASSFAATAWPASLEPLRAALQQEFDAARQPSGFIYQTSLDVIDDEATALVIPIPDVDMIEAHNPGTSFLFSSRVIIVFDLDFIRDQFIPQLAARYFTSGDGLDYRLAVTRRDNPASVIYQTENGAAEKIGASADATAVLFGLRMETPALIEGLSREIEHTTVNGSKKERVAVRFFNLTTKSDRVIVKADQDKEKPQGRIALINRETGRWLVALKHRAGSLDAAVAAARRRNLAVSFGILLLLSVSIAMIVVSTRRAERLARQQMEFVAGVSHEMRTPLAVICAAGENLADGVIEERQQVRRYGSLIESEGRRLSEMIEQALEFAGIQSGRKAYALQPAETARIIESALAACAPLIEEGGFTIEKRIAAHLPPIAADAAALSRAIQNLLNNALKYSGDNRWVRLTAKPAAGQPATEVQITIEDRGLGIAAADLPHIFEPFYRSDEVASAQIHGSGLGLSLVKHIVEAHGGRIRVESTTGRGSAFTLHLPALMQTDAAPDEDVALTASEHSQSTTQKPEFSR